jgi:hypothetical protein
MKKRDGQGRAGRKIVGGKDEAQRRIFTRSCDDPYIYAGLKKSYSERARNGMEVT